MGALEAWPTRGARPARREGPDAPDCRGRPSRTLPDCAAAPAARAATLRLRALSSVRSGADGEGSGLWGGEGLGGGGGGERGLGEGCHAGGRGEGRRGAANLHGSGSTGMLKAGSGVGEGEAERQRLSDAASDSVSETRPPSASAHPTRCESVRGGWPGSLRGGCRMAELTSPGMSTGLDEWTEAAAGRACVLCCPVATLILPGQHVDSQAVTVRPAEP